MTAQKDQISAEWPTIFELAAQIPQMDLSRARSNVVGRPPVTQGLAPEPFPIKEGYWNATPEQIASLRVPRIEVNGDIKGFQRERVTAHARKIARAMLEGKEMPPMLISIFPDGKAYANEGQHRALGAIIARKNVEVVVKRRTVEQARDLFTNQSKARKVSHNDTLLTGNSPIELYIQDAVTTSDHPWSNLVSPYASRTKMSVTAMATMAGAYGYNTIHQSVTRFTSLTDKDEPLDIANANKLATLLACFGDKATNPLAFRTRSLRAITFAALYIVRRNPHWKAKDYERWVRHMPTFDWARYSHMLNREGALMMALVEHWNKRLPEDKRVKIGVVS